MKTLIGVTVALFVIAIGFGISGGVGLSGAFHEARVNELSCVMGATTRCSPADSQLFSRGIIDLSIAAFSAFFAMMALLLTLHARAIRQVRG